MKSFVRNPGRNYIPPPTPPFLGSDFGRTDFSRIFTFEPPDFFADFVAGFFLIFVGKSAQKNSPGKSPAKSSKIYTTKILRHISAEGPGQPFLAIRHFSGEGGGGVYFEAPRGRNFIRPPPFYTPPTPRRVFSGWGGGGRV